MCAGLPGRRSFGPGLIFLILFASRQKEYKPIKKLRIYNERLLIKNVLVRVARSFFEIKIFYGDPVRTENSST
jgi:hypothetical protein